MEAAESVEARAKTYAVLAMVQNSGRMKVLSLPKETREWLRYLLAVAWVEGRGDGIKSMDAALDEARRK